MSRVRLAMLVLVCGCNQILGLSKTNPAGPAFYDAPLDAPFACPMIGSDLPTFTGVLVQQILQDCAQYSPSDMSGRAVATCSNPDGSTYVGEGAIGEMLSFALQPATLLPQPRLSSDGNTLYVRDGLGVGVAIIAYVRAGTAWSRDTTADLGAIPNVTAASTFMRGPDGDHVLLVAATDELLEYGHEGGSWHQTSAHSAAELGVAFVEGITVTSDGRHALVLGGNSGSIRDTMYTDRAGLDAPFRPATRIEGLFGNAQDATLTDDCARVYFTGLGSVFYVQQ